MTGNQANEESAAKIRSTKSLIFDLSDMFMSSKEIQAAIFMATIGPEAIQIFNNFNLPGEKKNNIDVLTTKFQQYFVPKINIYFERYQFHKIEILCQFLKIAFDDFLNNIDTCTKRSELENCKCEICQRKRHFTQINIGQRRRIMYERIIKCIL